MLSSMAASHLPTNTSDDRNDQPGAPLSIALRAGICAAAAGQAPAYHPLLKQLLRGFTRPGVIVHALEAACHRCKFTL